METRSYFDATMLYTVGLETMFEHFQHLSEMKLTWIKKGNWMPKGSTIKWVAK